MCQCTSTADSIKAADVIKQLIPFNSWSWPVITQRSGSQVYVEWTMPSLAPLRPRTDSRHFPSPWLCCLVFHCSASLNTTLVAFVNDFSCPGSKISANSSFSSAFYPKYNFTLLKRRENTNCSLQRGGTPSHVLSFYTKKREGRGNYLVSPTLLLWTWFICSIPHDNVNDDKVRSV